MPVKVRRRMLRGNWSSKSNLDRVGVLKTGLKSVNFSVHVEGGHHKSE